MILCLFCVDGDRICVLWSTRKTPLSLRGHLPFQGRQGVGATSRRAGEGRMGSAAGARPHPSVPARTPSPGRGRLLVSGAYFCLPLVGEGGPLAVDEVFPAGRARPHPSVQARTPSPGRGRLLVSGACLCPPLGGEGGPLAVDEVFPPCPHRPFSAQKVHAAEIHPGAGNCVILFPDTAFPGPAAPMQAKRLEEEP